MTRFIVTPEDMDLDMAIAAIGEPPRQWQGRCYEIASTLADHLENAVAVYGHYRGLVAEDGHWGNRAHLGFIQHGWIIFKGSDYIMDPTRWSFENEEPYIYYGSALRDEYDEGGNEIQQALFHRPCPSFDHKKKVVEFLKATPDSALARHLNALLHSIRMEQCLRIDEVQAYWLANVHYARLEPFAKEIYQGLSDAGLQAYIPLDNRRRAFRTW